MKLLWLQAAGCGGCTQSLLGAESRAGVLAQFTDSGLDLIWHPGLSEASGDEARAILQAAADGRLPFDILCVEGALLRGPNGSGRFQMLSGSGRPVIDWVRELADLGYTVPRQVAVPDTGHDIQLDQPEVIAEQFEQLLARARTH